MENLVALLLIFVTAISGIQAQTEDGAVQEVETEPVIAVLWPWFSLAIGTFTYFFLSRYATWMPYTAVMFIIGTIIGVVTSHTTNHNDILKESVQVFWSNIDSEVLLLTFLPGLIAKDALTMDYHLFQAAFLQCFIFAFPMVLAGTCLTAVVAFYIFPYGWSFNFAMMFGSILSATDPVAVSALLNSLGAPPRMKIHISGESLLNDGSAIVFFTIFSQLFLLELGIEGYGTEIDVAQGFAIFFRMSLGAFAGGLFFGFGTLAIVMLLKRRLSSEENVVEVATVLTFAYLTYFTTDVVWGCSGVIGTLTYGLVLNAFGHNAVNDRKLSDDFWSIVEHLLNTVLFALGGLVWGTVIANNDPYDPRREFTGTDWGFLFLLYVLLNVIRFFLVFAFYPITVSCGLRTSWQEAVFESWGGLRGAVGISLGIVIDNRVVKSGSIEKSIETSKLFGMVGGIAFLTLCVNATTAGPILKALGLADATNYRKKIVSAARRRIRLAMIDNMVQLLSFPPFSDVSFTVIRSHVPQIKDLSKTELAKAVRKFQKAKAKSAKVYLGHILPYLENDENMSPDDESLLNSMLGAPHNDMVEADGVSKELPPSDIKNEESSIDISDVRRLFLELVRNAYSNQVEVGYLAEREYLLYALETSVQFSTDALSKDDSEPLNDWKFTKVVKNPHSEILKKWKARKVRVAGVQYKQLAFDIELCLSFSAAHKYARNILKNEFAENADALSANEQKVIEESKAECTEADKLLDSYPAEAVEWIVSHKFCNVLLNNAVTHCLNLTKKGVLLEQEASGFLEEVQEQLFAIESGELEIEKIAKNETKGIRKSTLYNCGESVVSTISV